MIHRLSLLHDQGVEEPMEIDESSMAYKLYKDFKAPPAPAAYEHLNLPQHWIISMFDKSSRKRSHKKSGQGAFMSFQRLAREVAMAYKKIDPDTKAWLDETATSLYKYNRAQTDQLWRFIKGQRKEHEFKEKEAREAEARANARKAKADAEMRAASTGGEPQVSYISPPISRESFAMSFGSTNPNMNQHLQTIQMQALALSARAGYTYPHVSFASMYPSSALSQHRTLQMQSLQSPKKERDDTNEAASRESKRLRLEHHEAAFADLLAMNAYSQSSCVAPSLPFTNRAGGGTPSLGADRSFMSARAFEESASRGESILMGYRMGLMHAARSGASTQASNQRTNLEPSASSVGVSSSADAFTRSEFGLSYNDVIGAFNEMKKSNGRQDR